MTFVERQRRARQVSFLLLIAISVFVLVFSALVYFILVPTIYLICIVSGLTSIGVADKFSAVLFWDPRLYGAVTAFTLLVVLSGCYVKLKSLRAGGVAIARMLGCRRIYSSTNSADEKILLNIIDEISIASGLPVPLLYVIPGEPGINAFAAGTRPENSIIAVTEGTLRYLNRDELQAVMAHEFSHILNGDTLINMRLAGVLHGIHLFYLIGSKLLHSNEEVIDGEHVAVQDYQTSSALLCFGVMLTAIGGLGHLVVRIMKSAISRQREFLADSTAVQFTRNGPAVVGALKKIGGLEYGSLIHNYAAEELSHFFFSPALEDRLFRLFSTHPSLNARICAIDPSFNGHYPPIEELKEYDSHQYTRSAHNTLYLGGGKTSFTFQPEDLLKRMGVMNYQDIQYAHELRSRIPEVLLSAAHEPYGARALVYGLMLDDDPDRRLHQIDYLIRNADALVKESLSKVMKLIEKLPAVFHLPLLDIATPALHELSADELTYFGNILDVISEGKTNLKTFDLALIGLLEKRLQISLGSMHKLSSRKKNAGDELLHQADTLLWCLAHLGTTDSCKANKAHQKSRSQLNIHYLFPVPDGEPAPAEFFRALVGLSQNTAPLFKEELLYACGVAVADDGKITVEEAELIRVICEILELPMPPIRPSEPIS